MAIETTQSPNSANNISVNNNESFDNDSYYKDSSDESLKIKVKAENRLNRLISNSRQSSKNSPVISLEDGDSSIASDSENEENVISECRDCESNDSYTTHDMNGILMNEAQILEKSEPDTNNKSNIGNIVVHNSSDVTFGNKTFYQGPVTIKQFLLDNNAEKGKNGNDNLAYVEVNGSSYFKTDKNSTEGEFDCKF